ncbi:MAG TPA: penicillin-binding protein 2 [Anaerolineales bacterium]|nr:penicillin-binding protein 2 [Anaerolineales bacterium]
MAPRAPQLPPRGLARRLALLIASPRLVLLACVFLTVLGLFGVRLYQLQVREADYWMAQAQEQRARLVRLPAPRGLIYGRDGELLVRNVPAFQVAVIPALLPEEDLEREAVLRRLAALLDLPYTRSEPAPSANPGRWLERRLTGSLPQPDAPPGLREMVEKAERIAPYEPLVVARKVDREIALIIAQGEGLTFPGVRVGVVSRRQYPYGSLVAQLVGYLGAIPAAEAEAYADQGYDPTTDRIGYAGIEASFEDWLKGKPGQRFQEEDVVGRLVRVLGEEQPPVPGHNVYLTIDLKLQQVVQDALWRGMTRPNVNSRRGVVIVMNPQTGEVLAMVSLPTYDNNLFAQGISPEVLQRLQDDPHRPLLNHAVFDELPPGSIFKIIPAAAALQEGVLTSRTRLHCPGTIVVPNKYYPNDPGRAQPFHCWLRSGHGWLDIVHGLAHSCDIFFYQVGGGLEEADFEGLGLERMTDYARLFGLGEPTGIELPLEAAGLVPTARWKRLTIGENWSTGDTYNLSIGQGYLLVTPLQMLNMMAATANGGILYRPQIVHHITDAGGNVVQPFRPEIIRTLPISPENWTLIHEGLEGAVAYGTATRGQVDGVRVAGKTGTAQFCDDIAQQMGICGTGLAQPTHAWFIAFAPVEAPEIAVIVFIYNGGEGSVAAVPVAQEVLDWYFHGRSTAARP